MSTSQNYRTLVIAGLGSIGSGMFRVGGPLRSSFPRVLAVDCRPKHLSAGEAVDVVTGDVRDGGFLAGLLRGIPHPVLFLNLCAGIDNVRLRQSLAALPVAYLDSCCCAPEGKDEHRFSRMMPYTLTPVESPYPHWVCWGINPGLVELAARKLLRQLSLSPDRAEVAVFEHDGLHTPGDAEMAAAGWCPAYLVEEMLVSPALVVEEGMVLERAQPGGTPALSFWGGESVPCRVVGHEDIWNLGRLLKVRRAFFAYGLHPGVMAVLDRRDPRAALARLRVPSPSIPVSGLERIAVRVSSDPTRVSNTLLWETDHEDVWKRHGVNAAQFQTCLSLRLALHLLQHTRYGRLPGTWCGSTLPMDASDWTDLDHAMAGLGIAWKEADHLNLRLE